MISFKQLVSSLDKGLVVHLYDAAINLVYTIMAAYQVSEANKTEVGICIVMVHEYGGY